MRALLLVAWVGCAGSDDPDPLPGDPVIVPPLGDERSDSGWLEPQGTLPDDAFGCPRGSIALGQSGSVAGIAAPTRRPGVGICLWPERRASGSPDCRLEGLLPLDAFDASGLWVDGAGDEVHVCYRRVFECPDGRRWGPALKGRGGCRGAGLEYVAVWFEADEPASFSAGR